MKDKEMNKLLRGVFDSLTDGQKEKAQACKTPEELMALMGETGAELPDELLDEVAGGGFWQTLCDWVADLAVDESPSPASPQQRTKSKK